MRSKGQFNARVRKRNASGEICKSDVNNYTAYERLPTALQSFAYFLVALCWLSAGVESKYVGERFEHWLYRRNFTITEYRH